MISTLRLKNNIPIGVILASLIILLPYSVQAQGSLSLSVSPTLFDMSAAPGQEWVSSIRVINSNAYEISVYADVVNFSPQGEGGQGKFLPVVSGEGEGNTIAEWIGVTNEAIVIPAEKTIEIPFRVLVPDGAEPGGHFAAVMIGTKPPLDNKTATQVQTSQVVTTLVFLRVAGEINEAGNIRSFRTTQRILEKPEATFELRFENKGNVHIIPQGEIKILNMWGEERGIIPVNRETLFGNVLPDSVRKYNFTWKGEWSLSDIGRYRAIATLAYGEESRQFADSETAFWVIPWKILLFTILILGAVVSFFTWAIKIYIKKMLAMAGVQTGYREMTPVKTQKKKVSLVGPLEAGMLDLRGRLGQSDSMKDSFWIMTGFVKNYRLFFTVVLGFILFLAVIFLYVGSALVNERSYEVTIDGTSSEVKISSEDLAYEKLNNGSSQFEVNKDLPKISIVNRSGINGMAALLRLKLESLGYEVTGVSNDIDVKEEKTVIVYPPDLAEKALSLSKEINGALLSSFVGDTTEVSEIVVYAGKDMIDVVQ